MVADMTASATAGAWRAAAACVCGRRLALWPVPLLECGQQFFTRGISPMYQNGAVDEGRRQRVVAEGRHQSCHARMRRERFGLLGEAAPRDSNASRLDPSEVARNLEQRGIESGAADAGRAAHGGIVDIHAARHVPCRDRRHARRK